jgi:hypothetical protein
MSNPPELSALLAPSNKETTNPQAKVLEVSSSYYLLETH